MWKKLLFCFCITLLTVNAVSAQSEQMGRQMGRQITNVDLEKYRDARLAAEKDLRENYERLGFPSPEEIERRREKSRVETEELAAKLRASRLEQERLDAQREVALPRTLIYNRDVVRQNDGYSLGGYYNSYYAYPHPIARRKGYTQSGYYAGGQFWPTGGRTAPRPLFTKPRNR